jgi:hypothetical protein
MKKRRILFIGCSVFICNLTFAQTLNTQHGNTPSLEPLKGRYALDCSKEKAHDLSYAISNQSIFRLISAKKKHALFKSMEQKSAKSFNDYQYLMTAKYQGFTVDFYQKDKQNYARVFNTSASNFFGPKTDKMLIQCENRT